MQGFKSWFNVIVFLEELIADQIAKAGFCNYLCRGRAITEALLLCMRGKMQVVR